MSDDGERITITDTRAIALDIFWELTPLESQIYRLCDRAITPQALLEILRAEAPELPPEDIAPALDRMVGGRLMAGFGDRYLSLAVDQPSQPLLDAFPGGMIDWRLIEEVASEQRVITDR